MVTNGILLEFRIDTHAETMNKFVEERLLVAPRVPKSRELTWVTVYLSQYLRRVVGFSRLTLRLWP